MYRVLTALLCAGLVLSTVPAPLYAQGTEDGDSAAKVEKLSKQAAKQYRAGKYAEAIELFKQAYEIEPVPNILFNIAKCNEKREHWEDAITYYKKFVVAPDVQSEARETALDRIDALEEVVAAKKGEKKGDEKKVADKDQDKKKTEKTKKPVAPPPEPKPDRTLAYITLGGSAALLAGGGVFGILAAGQQSNFDDATTVDAKRAAKNKGETFALVADILYALGALGTIGGVILFATASPAETPPPAQAQITGFSPWVSPHGGGLAVFGRF